MNTPNPTPNPLAERVSAAAEVVAAAASSRWESTPNRGAYVHTEIRRAAQEAARAASTLVAAAARAEVADKIRAARERGVPEPPPDLRAATRRELDVYRTGQMAGLRIAEHLAAAPAESVAAGSVVSTEGSAHPHGDDNGHDGYMSTRCEEGRPGCVGRGCICRCHTDQPGPGPWTGPRPSLTSTEDRWANTGCESCRRGSCAGHPFAEVYPDRPLDTPEGDTDAH